MPNDLAGDSLQALIGPLWRMDHDPEACLLLESWARRPWDRLCMLQVADRLEELGESIGADLVRQGYRLTAPRQEATGQIFVGKMADDITVHRDCNRRERARKMKAWREWLRRTFGNFQKDTSPRDVLF